MLPLSPSVGNITRSGPESAVPATRQAIALTMLTSSDNVNVNEKGPMIWAERAQALAMIASVHGLFQRSIVSVVKLQKLLPIIGRLTGSLPLLSRLLVQ